MQPIIQSLNLYRVIKGRHSDGLIQSKTRGFTMLFELGDENFQSPQMLDLLEKFWNIKGDTVLYVIDLKNIDFITPPIAKVLIEAFSKFADKRQVPILFSHARPFTLESLESQTERFNPTKMIWVTDEEGNAHVIGKIPKKLKQLLEILERNDLMSASQLATVYADGSKKAIGNYSIYLNKLFNWSLVSREKVNASKLEDVQPRWIYLYRSAPNLFRDSQSKFLFRP